MNATEHQHSNSVLTESLVKLLEHFDECAVDQIDWIAVKEKARAGRAHTQALMREECRIKNLAMLWRCDQLQADLQFIGWDTSYNYNCWRIAPFIYCVSFQHNCLWRGNGNLKGGESIDKNEGPDQFGGPFRNPLPEGIPPLNYAIFNPEEGPNNKHRWEITEPDLWPQYARKLCGGHDYQSECVWDLMGKALDESLWREFHAKQQGKNPIVILESAPSPQPALNSVPARVKRSAQDLRKQTINLCRFLSLQQTLVTSKK